MVSMICMNSLSAGQRRSGEKYARDLFLLAARYLLHITVVFQKNSKLIRTMMAIIFYQCHISSANARSVVCLFYLGDLENTDSTVAYWSEVLFSSMCL